uniref:PID domain-containing protein n=1 Tax=Plectus sambesii TaxID=2011161 RepID=A0A914W443_9BILA
MTTDRGREGGCWWVQVGLEGGGRRRGRDRSAVRGANDVDVGSSLAVRASNRCPPARPTDLVAIIFASDIWLSGALQIWVIATLVALGLLARPHRRLRALRVAAAASSRRRSALLSTDIALVNDYANRRARLHRGCLAGLFLMPTFEFRHVRRDFAYVARDRNSRRFMCHVFRCDTPARTIANTLRDICKRLMLERRPNTLQTALPAIQNGHHGERRRVSRESSFPTPMEEPKKVIRCHFLGVTQVPRATGIEILNEAVDRLVGQVRQERWILVDVSIAPSTITITEVGGNQIAECRVRYLSFLGIGRDVKHCAFIMHTSSENFMCYVFHVEPSAGAMAKTIEAACKLRYQKVLDAHSGGGSHRSAHSINGK